MVGHVMPVGVSCTVQASSLNIWISEMIQWSPIWCPLVTVQVVEVAVVAAALGCGVPRCQPFRHWSMQAVTPSGGRPHVPQPPGEHSCPPVWMAPSGSVR